MILESFPGLRLVRATGTLVRAARFPTDARPFRRGDPRDDGRRERLAEAQEVLDRLAAGWTPSEADCAGTPILDAWGLAPRPDGLSLFGLVEGHPLVGSASRVVTSPLIALDGRGLIWARTVSRFYRLGRPDGRGPSS